MAKASLQEPVEIAPYCDSVLGNTVELLKRVFEAQPVRAACSMKAAGKSCRQFR